MDENVSRLLDAASNHAVQDWKVRQAMEPFYPGVVTLTPSEYEWRCPICRQRNTERPYVAQGNERVQCDACHAHFDQEETPR